MNFLQKRIRLAVVRNERRKHKMRVMDAENAVSIKFVDNKFCVTIESVPIMEVKNDEAQSPYSISFELLPRFLKDIRRRYIEHSLTKTRIL